jgi:hypothetical protein
MTLFIAKESMTETKQPRVVAVGEDFGYHDGSYLI